MERTDFPSSLNIMTSVDDKLVYAMGQGIGTRVLLRETGEKVDQIKGPKNNSAKVSPDGEYVAFYETENRLHLYKTSLPHTLCFNTKKGKHTDGVFTFADGGKVILADDRTTVYTYDVPSGKCRIFYEMEPGYSCSGIATMGSRIMIFAGIGSKEVPDKMLLYDSVRDLSPKVYTFPGLGGMRGEFLNENHFMLLRSGQPHRQEFLEGMDEGTYADREASKIRPLVWRYAFDGPTDLVYPEEVIDVHEISSFALSTNKQYCITKAGTRVAILYRTDTWERLTHIVTDYVGNVAISPSGNYWLVAGRPKSRIMCLPQL